MEIDAIDPALLAKKRDFEAQKARTKLALNICTICGNKDARACQGCGTTAYCSTDCQRIDWRDRGHRKACKKIRKERAAEAARAEAPTPPPSPPVYGPAPRSHADEVRARIAAEHEAARALREANPEPEPESARFGSCCPICLEAWSVNLNLGDTELRTCCCRMICRSCSMKIGRNPCPLCRMPYARNQAEVVARMRRNVEKGVPEAINDLGLAYRKGEEGLSINPRKAVKLFKRAVEAGNVDAMVSLGSMYIEGEGVKQDKEKAMQLFQMASDRGNARAQNNIGTLLLHEDEKAAFPFHLLAAKQGMTVAEYNVAAMYMNGQGVDKDLHEALRWFKRTAAKPSQVQEKAKEGVKFLTRKLGR